MPANPAKIDTIREDIRAIGDTASVTLERLAAHDTRFNQIYGRVHRVERELASHGARCEQFDEVLAQISLLLEAVQALLLRPCSICWNFHDESAQKGLTLGDR